MQVNESKIEAVLVSGRCAQLSFKNKIYICTIKLKQVQLSPYGIHRYHHDLGIKLEKESIRKCSEKNLTKLENKIN